MEPQPKRLRSEFNGGMEQGNSSQRDKTSKRDRRNWTKEEEDALIVALEDLCTTGMRCDNGTFRQGYTAILEKALLAKFPDCGLRAQPHIENKVRGLKKMYCIVADMKKQSGFGWNEDKKCIEVEDENIWNAYIQNVKDAASWRNKYFPLFDRLEIIFGKYWANGKGAKAPADMEENMDMGVESIGSESTGFSYSHDTFRTQVPEDSKRKRRKVVDSWSNTMLKVVELFGNYLDRSNEQMDRLIERIGHQKDFNADARGVCSELAKMNLTEEEEISASILIVEKPSNVDLFWSFEGSKRIAFVHRLLSSNSKV